MSSQGKKALIITIFLIVGYALPAQAGIISAMMGLLGSSTDPEPVETGTNSQLMPLLEAATNFDPNPIKDGADAIVVDRNAVVAEVGPEGTLADLIMPKSDIVSVYTVRQGDTAESVAKMFDVTVNTILAANNLKRGQKLAVGDQLVILPISGIRHTVKRGDTIAKIAKLYRASADDISQFNELASDKDLIAGEIIMVPGGELVTAAIKKNYATGGKWSSPTAGTSLLRPVNGCRKTQGIHPYNAIDLGCPVGTTLYAAASGRVVVARSSGWNGGYANYIVIAHPNGTQTLYGHLSRVKVVVGQKVGRGEVIGATGNTGNSTGPHLHFEVRGGRNPF